MNKQSTLPIVLLSCLLFLCCRTASQKRGEQQASTPESNKSEEKQKASIAELKRLYEATKSQYERRAVCLRAIDEGAIYRDASVSTIDEIFGTHFATDLPSREEATRIVVVNFVPAVPAPSRP